jgi:hypothetical protein
MWPYIRGGGRQDLNRNAPGDWQRRGFIPPHGGYEGLLSYKKSEIVFDATVKFCDRFIDKRSRTHD